jgi:sugar O-acyltransferase (sialic acid O-acetyltransferase NeuD family)
MDKIVIIGGGGHAKVVISVLRKSGYDIAGYTDRENRGMILGVQYLGDDGILKEILTNNSKCSAIIGIGKIDTSELRIGLQRSVGELGFNFPVIVSPHAVVNEEVSLGDGTVVFDGVVVNSGTEIGRACIINTHSTVEHDCQIGDNVHLAPGVTLSGGVTIGNNCFIGTGANIIQCITICENCSIGAGSTVVSDITIPGIYAGNPVKRIK